MQTLTLEVFITIHLQINSTLKVIYKIIIHLGFKNDIHDLLESTKSYWKLTRTMETCNCHTWMYDMDCGEQ
jgi:hypothetical protein